MTINEMKQKTYQAAQKRKVYGDDPEKAIIEKLKEEVKELQSAMLKNNKGCFEEFNNSHCLFMSKSNKFEYYLKNTKGDELADIIIVCLAAAVKLNIDIERHLELKMEYNDMRGD